MAEESKKKKMDTGHIVLGVLLAALLVYGIIATYYWMSLRTDIGIVATKTKSPSSAAVDAAVNTLKTTASAVTT